MVSEYLKEFPEHKNIFKKFQEDIHQITYRLYNWYANVYIKKYFERESIPYEYKPHCDKLHKIYKTSICPKKALVEATPISGPQ